MRRRFPMSLCCMLCTAALLAAGCGDSASLHCVRGHVRFDDDSPVTSGMVECYSPSSQRSCRGAIQPDGSFQIGSSNGRDGAAAGTHQVIVLQTRGGGLALGEHAQHTRIVDPKYQRYETSGLTLDVADRGMTTGIILRVSEAPPRRRAPRARRTPPAHSPDPNIDPGHTPSGSAGQ